MPAPIPSSPLSPAAAFETSYGSCKASLPAGSPEDYVKSLCGPVAQAVAQSAGGFRTADIQDRQARALAESIASRYYGNKAIITPEAARWWLDQKEFMERAWAPNNKCTPSSHETADAHWYAAARGEKDALTCADRARLARESFEAAEDAKALYNRMLGGGFADFRLPYPTVP